MDIRKLAEDAFRNISTTRVPYHETSATIFAISAEGRQYILTEYPDVYSGLGVIINSCAMFDDALVGNPLRDAVVLGVITTGWAAPIGEADCRPAELPERRRVRLVLIVTENLVMGSVIGFEDDPSYLLFDEGNAVGVLSETVLDAMRAINDYRFSTVFPDC
jgi:hypothetical protein